MTKQLNLDLAAALEDAQQGRDDGAVLIVRAGSAYMKVKAFNAGKHAASLRKIRKPRISKAAERRIFPVFIDGMSTAQYVRAYERLNAKFVREEMLHLEYEGPFFGTLPYEGLNESPCALYENGARDFDVIEEIDAEDAQSVAAPEVQSAPPAAVDSLYNPGTPDPKNSAALPELGGFRPGDVVDVDGRTIGRSTIELVFLRKLAGFDAEAMARIVGASGKRLDVQLFQLTHVGAQDAAESKAAAPELVDVLAIGASEVQALPEPEYLAQLDAMVDINYYTEALMMQCLRAGRDDLSSAIAHLVRHQRSDDYMGLTCVFIIARRAISDMLAGRDAWEGLRDDARALLASWGLSVAAPSAQDTPCSGIAPASPEYVALRSAARVARRAALAAIDTARVSSAQALRELTADDADYSYLIPTDGTHRGGVHAAKNIRLVLKKKFPGVKFKVTSDYSRCSVKWTDGPTDAAVCEALAPFDIGASDSQSDYFYTVATRFSDTYGGVQYLFTSRELGAATIQASIAAIFGDSGPTPEEWKAGRAWSQVSGHGIYSSCAMMDEWEWLAMVRRHANGLDY